jgi:lysine 6-dehydrogenase
MRVAVLGAGLMGRAAVHDLSRAEGVSEVRLFDRDPGLALNVAARYGAGRTVAAGLDVSDGAALRVALEGCSAALGAVSYRFNVAISEACIDVRCHYADLGGNNAEVTRQFELSERARKAGVALVPDTGLAPGLASVLAAAVLERRPSTERLRIRCGGLPLHPKEPFHYQVVFSVEGLINEYKEPTFCLRDGEIARVRTLSDVEEIVFPEPFGRLEAFNTSGGCSTLPWTLCGRVRDLDYKTLRYPGHVGLMQQLFALGLAAEEPVRIDGAMVRPRSVLEACLRQAMWSEGPDAVLLLVEGTGPEGTFAFRIIDRADERTGLSAMMRCTAFPAAILTHMLASGIIGERGTLHQELVVPTARFVDALRTRGIPLEELVS